MRRIRRTSVVQQTMLRHCMVSGGDAMPGCVARQVVYELRIYSMEPGSFGAVVRSRQVKAPHCITSIQFSPTSEHLLIAYGRCDVLPICCTAISADWVLLRFQRHHVAGLLCHQIKCGC